MIQLFEHNQIAHDAVRKQLAETGKACVIHPTGTGKSFIAFKWIEEHPEGRFVWLGPSENIYETQLENLKRVSGFVPENTTFLTYAKLMLMSEEEIRALNPTHAVMDEFHRTGAEHWEHNVRKLLALFPDMEVLGLSATPVRYLDNRRDMSDEIFNGCIADSMTLGEAIARGILPVPKYVTGLYNIGGAYERQLHNYEDRIRRSSAAVRKDAEECLDRLRRILENAEGLDKVFERYLKKGKYIAFCANVEHMVDMIGKVSDWFAGVDGDPHVYSVWADSASARRDYAAFKEDVSKHLRLLFCVDMFNEGIHVADIDGVILFRPTISPIIYKQQIGRAISAMKDGTPLIIDVVNNFENLYSISSIQEEMREIVSFYRNNVRDDALMVDSFQIIDEVREARDLLGRLEETLSLSWEQMFQEAKRYYRENGNLEVQRRYRTPEGIPLGQWVFSQRAIYNGDCTGLLDAGRIDLLNSIGMNWTYVRDNAWENAFEHARDYMKQHGSLDVKVAYVCADGFRLGAWIGVQRGNYMRLLNAGIDPMTDEKLNRLNTIGMIWKTADAAFEEGFLEATRYAAKHGDLEVPTKYVSPDGFKLGAWINRMRKRYAKQGNYAALSEEQIGRLESLGMQWGNRIDRQWDIHYEIARAYYHAHGDLNVPTDHVQDGLKLQKWITHQRQNLREGRLSEAQQNKLAEIGFSAQTRLKTWDENYEQAQRYFKAHGNLEVPPDHIAENGTWLGKWISTQRTDHKRGKLTREQIMRLDAIGMRWLSMAEYKWNKRLEMVRQYPRDAEGIPIVPEEELSPFGTKLNRWVRIQAEQYKTGKMDESKKTQWEDLIGNKRITKRRSEAVGRSVQTA